MRRMNFGNDKFYPADAIRDETFSVADVPKYKTYGYYAAQNALTHYREALALFGIRRTGKTTVLKQLWEEYRTANSVFLTIDKEVSMHHLMSYLERYSAIDFLFIDEITRIVDLDYNFHVLLDHYKFVGTKIVCTGTDSYLLSLTQRDTAFGRLELIDFLPVLFEDVKHLNCGYTFKEYCLSGKLFVADNYAVALTENIFSSIDKSCIYKHVLKNEDPENIQDAILLIVELLIGYMSNTLPTLKIKLGYSKYIIEEQQILTVKAVNKETVNIIFNILIVLDVIKVVPRFEIDTVLIEDEDENGLRFRDNLFYVSLPALYHDVLYRLTNSLQLGLTQQQLGLLFEACAVTQVEQKLKTLGLGNLSYQTFSLRSDIYDYEIDYCIAYGNVLTLVEFKTNAKKRPKHFYNELVQKLCAKYTKVNRYVVYLEDSKESNDDTDTKYVNIEDFLFNLQDYIQ